MSWKQPKHTSHYIERNDYLSEREFFKPHLKAKKKNCQHGILCSPKYLSEMNERDKLILRWRKTKRVWFLKNAKINFSSKKSDSRRELGILIMKEDLLMWHPLKSIITCMFYNIIIPFVN